MSDMLLLTPGPSMVPQSVLDVLSLPMMHHRTKQYQAILEGVNANLKKVFLTKHPVMHFASSGTGAMEAALLNCLSKGDTVLSFSSGKWGERYRDIAKTYGFNVKSYEKAYGEAFQGNEIKEALSKEPKAKAVLITLCETSTAVLQPVQEIAKVCQSSTAQPLLFVDAISGLACDEFKMDEWGVDITVCGSQKGLMLPPGLSFVGLSERAQSTLSQSNLPKYYFDFSAALLSLKDNDTPFTPAVSLVRGLAKALELILEEGLENVWARHAKEAARLRDELTASNFKLFAKRPSHALTAIVMPEGVDSGTVIKEMRNKYKVVMADGQGSMKGKIVRFAHMGASCTMGYVNRGLEAFKSAMAVAHK